MQSAKSEFNVLALRFLKIKEQQEKSIECLKLVPYFRFLFDQVLVKIFEFKHSIAHLDFLCTIDNNSVSSNDMKCHSMQ